LARPTNEARGREVGRQLSFANWAARTRRTLSVSLLFVCYNNRDF